MKRQTLGKKTYQVVIASVKGNAVVEINACTADLAKAYADKLYARDGWMAMSARTKKLTLKEITQ